MIVYGGSLDTSAPGTNTIVGNDDVRYHARTNNVQLPDGSAMGTCGAWASYCPQVTESLTGGTRYYIFISTFNPDDRNLLTLSGQNVTFHV